MARKPTQPPPDREKPVRDDYQKNPKDFERKYGPFTDKPPETQDPGQKPKKQ